MLSFDVDFKDVVLELEKQGKLIDKAVQKGLLAVAKQLYEDMPPHTVTPYQPAFSNTIGGRMYKSWEVEVVNYLKVIVGYNTPYAADSHQEKFNRPPYKRLTGQRYWFKATLDKNQKKYFKLFADTVGKEMGYL